MSILYCVPVLSTYVRDHAALPTISANADTTQVNRATAPGQTSALELLVFCCFRVLLVYPSALYYGMLILSRARGACPTPPENWVHVACSHFEWQKQWHLALWHDQNNGAFLFLTI